MKLETQLKHFIKENPKHKFRIATCKAGELRAIQLYMPQDPDNEKGWFCLHNFYEEANTFKLGYGF